MSVPASLNDRQKLIWALHDFTVGRGLEIGPLHNRIVPSDLASVQYLDVFAREQLIEHYAGPDVDTSLIPEIDFVLHDGNQVRSIPETIGDTEPFDWVVASHVVEHVPDLVGWLSQVAEIVRDGGYLVLAVPDRRYCFDHHRPATTVGQVIQAHDDGDTTPSVRAVYDSARGHATASAAELWAGEHPGYERRTATVDGVVNLLKSARAGEYIDSHVWTFTPGTFVEQLRELRELGLSEWAFEIHQPTGRGHLEFHTVLRRLPREKPWGDELFSTEPPVETDLPDWIAEARDLKAQAKRDAALVSEQERRIAQLQRQLDRTRERARTARRAAAAARQGEAQALRRLERSQRRLEAITSSTRWRFATLAAQPADRVRSVVGRRRG